MSGLQNYASGFPIAVGSGGISVPTGFGYIRPDLVGSNLANGSMPYADYSSPTQWLNQAAFANVPCSAVNCVPLRVGTAPRNLNIVGYPTIAETFRLSKNFPLWRERVNFRLGATLSNPFKRQQPYLNDGTVGDSGFGTVLQGGGGRTMQLEGRVDF